MMTRTDHLEGLNPRQQEAVKAVDGPLLIVAGPGSGKTRVITHRIAHLVDFRVVPPYRIAAVTFTNKAAREMQTRLFGSSPDDASSPLLDWSMREQGLTVSTFHAFCSRLLRVDGDHIGLDRGFAIYDSADQLAAVKRAMDEVDVDQKTLAPRGALSAISSAKSKLIGVEGFGLGMKSYTDELVHRVYGRYEDLLSQSSAVDFDDLLLKTHDLLRRFPDVAEVYQERYLHLMIDEFQDTNVAQYAIARLLAARHRNLCVVGDPDQSIYSWRNADIGNILSFRKDFPESRQIVLDQNYRSTQTILDAAQGLIAANPDRVEKELFTALGRGKPIAAAEGYDEHDEARLVVQGGGEARARRGLPAARHGRDVQGERTVQGDRGVLPAAGGPVPARRQYPVLPAPGDQGPDRLPPPRRQPQRRRQPRPRAERAATGHRFQDHG